VIGVYVVLAAGAGTRMGGPKALVEVDGETLLAHHLHAAQLARLGGPVVVTGAQAVAVEAAHEGYPVRWVRNPEPEAPMIASVRLGLAAVPTGNVAVITPVDVLPARLDTLDQLAEALEGLGPDSLGVRPAMRGRGGHPLLLTPGGVREVLADATVDRLDVWVREAAGAGRLMDLEVDDYNVLSNLNEPGDLP